MATEVYLLARDLGDAQREGHKVVVVGDDGKKTVRVHSLANGLTFYAPRDALIPSGPEESTR